MLRIILSALIIMMLPCAASAKSAKKERAEIMEMRGEVLGQLYANHPQAKGLIAEAEGYAVFNNGGVNLIFLSAGSGKGVAHDNKSGKDTYMRMASGGVGIGLGIKDYRAVMIFHTRATFDQFVDKGWDFSGQADAAAKIDDEGGEVNAAGTVVNGVTLYQMTKKGLALQATLQGTKYWKWKKLN